jgi:hypothetical protein
MEPPGPAPLDQRVPDERRDEQREAEEREADAEEREDATLRRTRAEATTREERRYPGGTAEAEGTQKEDRPVEEERDGEREATPQEDPWAQVAGGVRLTAGGIELGDPRPRAARRDHGSER